MSKLKYDESFPERAGEYAAEGMNNAEIAEKLEISEDTFYAYQRQFPEFAAAVETGRLAVAADKMEGNLMNMALGRCFSTIVRRSAGGRETKTIRQLVPNLKMLIRWLERNRQYADDGDIQASEPVEINIAVNSKYDESFLEDAERYAAEGYTDLQNARRLGIALSSFYNYKKQFPEFAAVLDSGKRECYGRLRCQLLELALGKCTVTTDTYRDGDFRKSAERQLPPNLKAIKYWMETAGGCPSGYAGRMGETASAQRDSKVSESGGCPPVASGFGSRMGETASAQWHSKVSESPEGDGAYETYGAYGRKTEKNDNASAQRHSKVSESGGCPSDYAGRMGETASAQRHSKVSESGGCDRAQPSIAEHCSAQRHSKVSELSGLSQTSQASQSSHKRTLAQKFAKMSRKERQRLLKNRQEVGNEK